MRTAFLKSQNGTITGIMSAEDHGDLRDTLLEWLLDDEAEMIVRAPIDVARRSLFESTSSVLSAIRPDTEISVSVSVDEAGKLHASVAEAEK